MQEALTDRHASEPVKHFAFGLSIAQTGNWFYSVNKLKKTNISHLLNLDFKNVPT
jgi:hypothetical protein